MEQFNHKLTFTAKLAIFLLSAVMAITAIFGIAGFDYGNITSEAWVTGTTIKLDNAKKDGFDNAGLKELMQAIGGADATSYSKLDNTYFTVDKKTADQIGATVELGGYKWNVAYVSRAKYGEKDLASNKTGGLTGGKTFNKVNNAVGDSGDIIVTLWLADTTVANAGIDTSSTSSNTADNYYYSAGGWSYYTKTLTASDKKAYPTNMYSSSYIRSQLNGTQYASYGISLGTNSQVTSGQNVTINETGVQKSAWETFIKTYGDYISTPAQMEWQYDQRESVANGTGSTWSAWSYDNPNSGLNIGTKLTTAYKSGETMDYSQDIFGNTASDTKYNAWGNDKIWLPSIFETGYDDSSSVGLWKTNVNQRKFSGGSYCWLRSGSNSYAYTASVLATAGGSLNRNVRDAQAVRPALHINLKSAANAAGGALAPELTAEAKDGLTYDATAQNAVKFDAEKSFIQKIEYTNGNGNKIVAEYTKPASGEEVTLAKVTYAASGGTASEVTDEAEKAEYTSAWTVDYTNGILKAKNAGTFDVTAGLRTPEWDGKTYLDDNGVVQTSATPPAQDGWKPWYGDAATGRVPNFWEIPPASGDAKPEWKIGTQSVSFTVKRAQITDGAVTGINAEYVYTGAPIEPVPAVAVTLASVSTPLVKDTDFTVTYSAERTDAGNTVKVTVTGEGNFEGTVEKSFTIKKATPTVTDVKLAKEGTLYDGAKAPELVCTSTFSPSGAAVAVKGTVTLDSEKLDKNVSNYSWTFTPEDTTNFEVVTGQITLKVEEATVESVTVTFDAAQYFADLKSGTAKKIFTSTDIGASLKGIIEKYLTVTGKMTDGNPMPEGYEYTLSRTDGKWPEALAGLDVWGAQQDGWADLADGSAGINITCGSCTEEGAFSVPVTYVKLTGIKMTEAPKTTVYTALTAFDSNGMVIKAVYNDGSEKAVTDYTILYNKTGETERTVLWYGDKKVTVSYMETNGDGVARTETCEVVVTVNRIVFDTKDLALTDASKPYTGEKQTIELTGEVPEAVTVTYTYELDNVSKKPEDIVNVVENDGYYMVYAQLTVSNKPEDLGYNYSLQGTTKFSAKLTVTKIDCDGLDKIIFEGGNAQYSASSKAGTLAVKNLPAGVTVDYKYYKKSDLTTEIAEEEVVERGIYTVKAVFTVDGNHNPIADKEAELEIIAHTLQDGEVTGIDTEYVYKGEAWKPAPTVTVELAGTPTKLTPETDYAVAYSTEEFAAGTQVTVTVTGEGNFEGSVTKIFVITKAALQLTWEYNGSGVYDSEPHSAELKVTGGVVTADASAVTTETLARVIKIDYTAVSGGNNAVTASGVYQPNFSNYPTTAPWSNYEPTIQNPDFTFTVAEATLPTITFEDKEVTYDGTKQNIEITVTDGTLNTKEIEVKYFIDDTANAFEGLTNAGSVRVRVEITCKTNNYQIPADIAKMYATLTVKAKEITENDVTGVEAAYSYNGANIEPVPAVAVVLTEGAEATSLTATRDYNVTYSDERLNAGTTVTVTVTGCGNYGGTVTKTFTIEKARLGYEWVGKDGEDPVTYTYNGAGQGLTADFTGVADCDKATIVPVIYYSGNTGTDYPESTEKPKNAGNYVVKIVLEAEHANYEDFTALNEYFTIEKATPNVTVKFVNYDPATGKLYKGQLMPEITVGTASLNETVTSVAGSISWDTEDGKTPVLLLNTNEYGWTFTPEGEDAKNFNAYSGKASIEAFEPKFKTMSVKWDTEDGKQPFLWSSATLDDLKQYLYVEGTLEDGTDFGRITTLYSLSGSWGDKASPKLNGYDETSKWDITVKLQTLSQNLTGVQYNLLELDRIEVTAADGNGIKTVYDALSEFDTDSITVTAYYKDGSKVEHITGYTVVYQQEDNRLWWGNTSVTISYNDGTVTDAATFTIDGLTVNKITFDTSEIAFEGDSVAVDYNGTAHSLKLKNEDKFTIGTIAYEYQIKNGRDWETLEGVTEVTDAGEYRVQAKFTIVDDELLPAGVYTQNYTLDYSLKSVLFTVNKIKYQGADDISFATEVTADYNGDTANLYASAIEAAATGVSEEVWGIVSYEYRVSLATDKLDASEAVHAGAYVVTVVFNGDKNHEPIASVNVKLTVNKINPTINPRLIGHAIKEVKLTALSLVTSEGDTEGIFTWEGNGTDDADNVVIISGINVVYYTFTPKNTRDFNTLTNCRYTIDATENYAVSIDVVVSQGNTKLFTSYTLDKLLELAADENEDLTIEVWVILNDRTEKKLTEGYTITLLSGNTNLDEGTCYLSVIYENAGETFEYNKASVHVLPVELGSITAAFEQNGAKIYTSGNTETLTALIAGGKASLTVTAFYNNGDEMGALTAEEYALSGDWSAMAADGEYEVTVTVNGTTVSTKFKIAVTLVTLTSVSAEFKQNGKEIFASDGVAELEKLIADGDLDLTVTAHYNDDAEKVIALGEKGYALSIAGSVFAVPETEVTVSYGEGAVTEQTTFKVKVTAVLVASLSAKINDVNFKIYTDTALSEVEKLLTVTAYYNDGTEGEVTDFSLTMPDGGNKLTAGTQVTVNLGYTGEDIADYFKPFGLIIGVVKHETEITFNGETEYTYDGTAHAITDGAATNHADDEKLKYEIDGAAAAVRNAGDYTLVISSEETDDYYAAALSVAVTVKKAVYDISGVVFGDDETVYDGSKHYITVGGTLPANVRVGGYVYTDGTGATCAEACATDAGKYTVTVSFDAFDAENYEAVPDMTAVLTVLKAEAQIDESGLFAAEYIYTGLEQTVTGATVVKADDGAVITYKNNTFTNVPAGGVLTVEIIIEEGTNYKAFAKKADITVKKAPLTLTANDNTIIYGEAPAADGVTAAGFVNGEDESALNGTLEYYFGYSQYGNAGEYAITLGGVSSQNYDITLKSGKLIVGKKEAKVDWTVEKHVYDGKPYSPSATFTDLFGTEVNLTVTVSGKNGGVFNEAVAAGDYIATAASVNPNYALTGATQPFTIIADTDYWVKFDFRKDYAVTYGSVPETAEQLAAMAKELIDLSYVRVDCNGEIDGLDDIIRLMTVRLEGAGNTPVTAGASVGRYNIFFEFKPEYAEEYAAYTVYQTVEDSENTNLGRLVVEQRKLTLGWTETEFEYDGEAHLPTATLSGFADGKPVSFAVTATDGVCELEADGVTFKVGFTVKGDFKSAGGHTVTVTAENGNYVIVNPYVTVSVSGFESGSENGESIPVWSWVIVGVGAALAVAGVVTFALAFRRKPSGGGFDDFDQDGFSESYDGE